MPILLLLSCIGIRMEDSIDLGNNFRYIQDYPQTIIYHRTEKYSGSGVNVVNPIVTAYDFNDRYIIAKSTGDNVINGLDSATLRTQYWIIDKQQKLESLQPLDSVRFYQRLRDLNVELRFNGN